MHFTNTQDTKREKTPSGNSVWRLLCREIGVPTFELRCFEIPVGGHTSYGSHPWEHEVYVVTGRGTVKGQSLEGETIQRAVQVGDAIYVAPNEEHQFVNDSNAPLGFICVCPAGCE